VDEIERSVAAPAQTRREEILSIAAQLFRAKGYSATAMSEVAAEVGIQKASLYHHDRTKESLLYELSVQSMRHMIETAAAITETTPLPRLRAMIDGHVHALLSDQNKHATALTELRALSPEERGDVVRLRDEYDGIVDQAIADVQAADGLWPDVETKLVRLALLGMLNWTVFWYQDTGAQDVEGIAQAFLAVFLP
jgi:AcrR family transcriptional regulator